MKKPIMKIVMGITFIVMLSAISIGKIPEDVYCNIMTIRNHTPADIVWSENFNDENISDWNIYEINWTLPDGTVNLTADPDELFSTSGGILRSIGPEWNFATFNSSIAYGTWTFDVDIQRPDEFDRFGVSMISEKFGEHWLPASGSSNAYFLSFRIPDVGLDGDIRLAKNIATGGTSFLDAYPLSDIRGWHSFIVTRELTGQFHVYLNGIHILEALDTTHTTSERFGFFGMANPAIDNVTVSNTIDYDKAPPTLLPVPPLYQTIYVGERYRYDLNASDPSGIDTWWLDDTQNFTIDVNGVITDNSVLSEGEYGIGVCVNDTQGYTRHFSFTVIVSASTTTGTITTTSNPTNTTGSPLQIELLMVAVGGTIVVILIIAIIIRRK